MDLFLCVETSTEKGSVGVFKKTGTEISTLGYKEWNRLHSERLPVEIQNVVKESECKFSNIQFLGVGQGPGRFTGIRTAINVVRTLSFTLKIPIFSKNTLRVFAEPFFNKQEVSVVCNAFKNSVYFAQISKEGKFLQKPCVLSVSNWFTQKPNQSYIGDAWEFYSIPEDFKTQNNFKKTFPTAHYLAQLIAREFKKEEGVSWQNLHPLYLRSLEHEK